MERRRKIRQDERTWWERHLSAGELLKYLGAVHVPDSPEPDQSRLVERLRALGSEIDQIKKEIESRLGLLERHKRQIDYQVERAAGSLESLQGGMGYNSGVDAKRNLLESQLASLRTELRNRVDRTWQDLVELRRGLRDLIRRYEALKRLLGRVENGDPRT